MSAWVVEIRLMGRFEVTVAGSPVPSSAWTHRRASDLVKLLALAPGNRLPRDEAIDALWPDLDAAAGAANLHKAASLARRALGRAQALVVRGGLVALAPDASVWCDASAFEDAARRALASGDRAACDAASALWVGDLLPEDRYEPWTEATRDRVRGLYLQVAAVVLGEAYLVGGRAAEALPLLEEGERLSRELGALGGASLSCQRQAEALVTLGRAEEARTILVEARALAQRSPLCTRHLLQRVYGTMIEAAPPETVLAAVEEAEVVVRGPEEGCIVCQITLAVPAARACARAGEISRGHDYLARAEQIARIFWTGGYWHACVAAIRRELDARKGAGKDPGRSAG